MRPVQDVIAGYRTALRFLAPFTLIHVAVRLLVAAVIVPLSGIVLALALAASGHSAVTDQDIARFVLTPAGAMAALVLVGLFTIAAVLDISVMSNALRRGDRRPVPALFSGLWMVVRRFPLMFSFAIRLLLRVLLLAAPFLLVGAAVAALALGRYDINYYLTYRPPAFLLAAGIGALVLVALAGLLLARFSAWAISLHLVLLDNTRPAESFADSARLLRGSRQGVVSRIAVWIMLRSLLAAAVAAVGGVAIGWAQELSGANLRVAALSTVILLIVVGVANAIAAALSNGALATLLDRLYREATGKVAPVTEATVAPAGRRHPLAVPIMLGVAAVLVVGGLAFVDEVMERVGSERQVEIIAHRGAAGSRPENTMAAIEKALDDGADWVEIDVQETADGAVVVAHDSDFMKLAGVDLKVWNATLADLAAIDIGSWFDTAYADQRTPTLREVLEAAKGRGKVLIELKYYGHDVALEARVADIVEQTGMGADVGAMSLKIRGVRKMQAIKPEWPHGILAATALGNISALDADFLAVNTGQVSLNLIRRVHGQGKKLYVWTVDDPLTMTRMISMGVDGLITNEPALARRVMVARNQLAATERLLLWLSDRVRLESFDLVAEEADA
ncbi:MAG: glycerophosphodiester phosphodiesterase [Wenzhouxiangellaceae bacterium]|nr:glycerophosphodiester phosphodiesterase [Wenzhouxiangellaceae bacterium]